ncbi:hypothetical protein [Agathobacter sp.]
MTYDEYRTIFYIALAAFVIMLITTIVIFIVLKIPNVIGSLSGKNARKAIADIARKQNESHTAVTSSGPVAPSYDLTGRTVGQTKHTEETGSEETVVLSDETMVLSDETMVLSDETVVLDTALSSFTITRQIEFIHTQECI